MTAETKPFTFLQISDVHLDAKLSVERLPMPNAQRRERMREIMNVFMRAIYTAREQAVDAVIIAGDLFDNESVTGLTVSRVIEACESLGSVPVIIAPGNRDYFCDQSLYNPKVIATRGIRPWPPNVHIFQSPDFTTFSHPYRGDVSFTGRAFVEPGPNSERVLKGDIPRSETAAINILVFHGSLDGYSGGDAGRPNKVTAPFSEAELRALAFTYSAIGHCHDYTEVRSESGLLLGAYSGSIAGCTFDELGPRYAILGSIEHGRAGRLRTHVEPLELDNRRMVMVGADISGLSAEDMMDEINLAIEDQDGRPAVDFVYLHLEGRYQVSAEPAKLVEMLRERFQYLVVMDNTRPDYLTEKYDRRTTEAKFIEALLDLKKQVEASRDDAHEGSGNGGGLSGAAVEDALYYGLDALKQKKVTVRDVD